MDGTLNSPGSAKLEKGGDGKTGHFIFALVTTLVFSSILRTVLFHGMAGSDDVVYFRRALDVAAGVWSSSNYTGALRYGFNLPAGFFIYLFGPKIFAANLFSFACSLGEVLLVACFAKRYWGVRAGIFAALILSVMPLHVNVATSIHADPLAAFFISASFVVFLWAMENGSRAKFFLTGLLIGYVFWVKELIIVYVAVFIIYVLIERRWDWKWLYIVLGGLILLFGHLALMWAIAGDPFHGFKVYFMQIDRDFIGGGKEADAMYYFRYLLLDLRHNWIVPYLALAGVAVILLRQKLWQEDHNRFLILWLVGLLVVFSFTPISLSPFQLITKQSNYLNLFFAPMAVAAGIFLAALSRRWTIPIMTVTVLGGVLLAALAQQDLRKFVSNSKAVAQLARERPDAVIYASVNNRNIASLFEMISPEPAAKVKLFKDMKPQHLVDAKHTFVVADRETANWGRDASGIPDPKPCWKLLGTLQPQDFGAGWYVAKAVVWTIEWLPAKFRNDVSEPFRSLLSPGEATVFEVLPDDPWCQAGSANQSRSERPSK